MNMVVVCNIISCDQFRRSIKKSGGVTTEFTLPAEEEEGVLSFQVFLLLKKIFIKGHN
jgi:hypothetical protein